MKKTGKEHTTKKRLKLSASILRAYCDPRWIPFETTAELSDKAGTGEFIHQERALSAIEFGLSISSRGYNIFAVGDSGSGKTSIIKKILHKRAQGEQTPHDVCYIHDFDDSDTPNVLLLPSGQGVRFAKAMDEVVKDLRREIPRILSASASEAKRSQINIETRKKEERLFKRLAREAKKYGLSLRKDEDRLLVLPLVNGEPVDSETYSQLSEEMRAAIEESAAAMHESFAAYDRQRMQLAKKANEKVLDEDRRAIKISVEAFVQEVRDSFEHFEEKGLKKYLDQVVEHILEHYRDFLPAEEWGQDGEETNDLSSMLDEGPEDLFVEYRVNVLVDRKRQKGAPVVSEPNPSYTNLMGFMEYRDNRVSLKTDHTLIRAGALHKANGGYLIIQVQDLAQHPAAWEALKKALRLKEIRTEDLAEEGRPKTTGNVSPAPVPLNIKVILIGSPENYYILKTQDADFERLFKVKADFAYSVERSKKNILRYAKFMARVAHEEKYLPLHREAVAIIIEEAGRLVEDQKEMSTRLSHILDLMAESNYWARRSRHKIIVKKDVFKALEQRRIRHSQEEDLVMDNLRRGTILLETKGAVIGQINGLAVYDLGDHAFGVPSRITAQVFVGKKGVVSIDREVKLSGAIHDKGALILIGYLGGKYAQQVPLAFSASVTFEQMYSGVEGDSASATELFALLSSLSGLPIKQGIAVTGSVNQLGEIQPVGGINEKIEGMYKICKMKGITGRQGVIIPRCNVDNLMLSDEVIAAVKNNEFSIWAVDNVDQAMELLTNHPAGKRRANGTYPPNTINARVKEKLEALAFKLEGHTSL